MEHLLIAFVLILVGLMMMAAELVIFSHGILSMIGLGGVIVGAIMVFGRDPFLGAATFLTLLIAVPMCARALFAYWPQSPIGKKFVLQPPSATATIASPEELGRLHGRQGKALSALRPAGVVDFDGRRIDALSEGSLIEPGQWVRCVRIEGTNVIVRPSAGLPADDLENMTL